jgi:hypothetical protein
VYAAWLLGGEKPVISDRGYLEFEILPKLLSGISYGIIPPGQVRIGFKNLLI